MYANLSVKAIPLCLLIKEDVSDIPVPRHKYDDDTLEEFQITDEDVIEKLIKLNPSKSPGSDGLHPRVMKETADILLVTYWL